MKILALTIEQPYAWAIIHGGCDVINRVRATRHRGLVVIHSGSTPPKKKEIPNLMRHVSLCADVDVPHFTELPRGHLLGVAKLVQSIPPYMSYDSIWAAEACHKWIFTDVKPFNESIPVEGKRGLWDCTSHVAHLLEDVIK